MQEEKTQKTGYRDAKGKEYEVGDIVFNPCFGDYWLVGKYSDNDTIKDQEGECPYYLCQYGDIDLYYMDLDEPAGFEIEVKIGSGDRYDNAIKELNEIAKFYKENEKDGKLEDSSENK